MVLLYSYMCVWVFWCVERPLLGQPWRMGHLLRPSLHFTQRQCILAFVNHHTIRTTNTKNIFAANNAHIDFQTLDIAKAINSSLKSQRCEWGIYYVEAHNGFQLTDPLSLSLSLRFFFHVVILLMWICRLQFTPFERCALLFVAFYLLVDFTL